MHLAEIGTSGVSGISHWRLGNVDMRTLLMLGIPGGVGAFLGAVVLSNLSLDAARPTVSLVLLALGGVIILRFIHGRRRPPGRARAGAMRRARRHGEAQPALGADSARPRRRLHGRQRRRWLGSRDDVDR